MPPWNNGGMLMPAGAGGMLGQQGINNPMLMPEHPLARYLEQQKALAAAQEANAIPINEMYSRARQNVSEMSPLRQAALGTMPIPFIGDALGLAADAEMFATEPESRTPFNFGLSALGMLPFIPGMTVFHGTGLPPKGPGKPPFEKFDINAVGGPGGEGAQAYGHGLYFAESPGTAKTYQMQNSPDIVRANRVADTAHVGAARNMLENKMSEDDVISGLKGAYPGASDEEINAALIVARGDKGSLIEADIPDSAISKMLDWDKPLSEQGDVLERVKGAVSKALDEGNLSPFAADGVVTTSKRSTQHASVDSLGDVDGAGALEMLERLYGREGASEALREAGIPGIKYLDQESRPLGEGTRNIVLFDDSLATILKVNSEPVVPGMTAVRGAKHIENTPVIKWAENKWGDSIAPDGGKIRDNFVRWFGDSKVVDEGGAPLVVYHGSRVAEQINEFKGNRRGNWFGEGAYFTNSQEQASLYALHGDRGLSADTAESAAVLPVYVSLKKPFVMDATSATKNQIDVIAASLSKHDSAAMAREFSEWAKKGDVTGWDIWNFLESPEFNGATWTGAFANDVLRNAGFDGLIARAGDSAFDAIAHGADHIVAFTPTQIKSAIGDAGTYSITDPRL